MHRAYQVYSFDCSIKMFELSNGIVELSNMTNNIVSRMCSKLRVKRKLIFVGLFTICLIKLISYIIWLVWLVEAPISVSYAIAPKSLGLSCRFAMPNPWHPSIMPLISHPRSFDCKRVQKLNLVYIDPYGWLHINCSAIELSQYETLNEVVCTAQSISRGNDDSGIKYSSATQILPDRPFPVTTETTEVNCFSKYHPKIFYKVFAFPHNLTKKGMPTDEHHLSVLLLVVDSMSYSRVRRSLSSTFSYITQHMNSFVFRGHHRVGYNTYPNMLPIFTGKRVRTNGLDMPAELDDEGGTNNYSTWPLIWWRARDTEGYISSFAEDWPIYNIFQQEAVGFGEKPADHVYRPFFLTIDKDYSEEKLCFRNDPIPFIQIDLFKQHAVKFKDTRQFAFSIIAQVAHDSINDVERMDSKLEETLRSLHEGGYLNKSVLVVMSDHGLRYHPIRFTTIGAVEENMPFVSVIMPKWFSEKHKNLVQNLATNQMRLTSHFDLHETFKDIVSGNYYASQRDTSGRSLSLLYEIPKNRTCSIAGIPEEFCTCNEMAESYDLHDPIVKSAGSKLVDRINYIIKSQSYSPFEVLSCATLYYNRVTRAERLISSHAESSDQRYRISVEVSPSYGLFEVKFVHNAETNEIRIASQISRINKYGKQSICVHNALKPFCYCWYCRFGFC